MVASRPDDEGGDEGTEQHQEKQGYQQHRSIISVPAAPVQDRRNRCLAWPTIRPLASVASQAVLRPRRGSAELLSVAGDASGEAKDELEPAVTDPAEGESVEDGALHRPQEGGRSQMSHGPTGRTIGITPLIRQPGTIVRPAARRDGIARCTEVNAVSISRDARWEEVVARG
jgi:hypothetical protein